MAAEIVRVYRLAPGAADALLEHSRHGVGRDCPGRARPSPSIVVAGPMTRPALLLGLLARAGRLLTGGTTMTITNPIRPDADAALRNADELARHPALRDVANVDAAATTAHAERLALADGRDQRGSP